MASPSPFQNHLLDSLHGETEGQLLPHLRLVDMPLGRVIDESGGHLSHVLFPTTCIISLRYVMEDGASAELSVVGKEGLVGISVFMGGDTTPRARHRDYTGPLALGLPSGSVRCVIAPRQRRAPHSAPPTSIRS